MKTLKKNKRQRLKDEGPRVISKDITDGNEIVRLIYDTPVKEEVSDHDE
jgi:hypothetical protein